MSSIEHLNNLASDEIRNILRHCLILNGCGVYLPRLKTRLSPLFLSLADDQQTSSQDVVELGYVNVMPKAVINDLLRNRGRVSAWVRKNTLQSKFGTLIPMKRWSDSPSSFRAMFDSVVADLKEIIDGAVSSYDLVVKQTLSESEPFLKASYRSLLDRYQKDPKSFPDYEPIASSDGIVPAFGGVLVTEQSFVERCQKYLKNRIPTIEELETKTKPYFNISTIPDSEYTPLDIAGSMQFDNDLQEACNNSIAEFREGLAELTGQIWEHVAIAANEFASGIFTERSDKPTPRMQSRLSDLIEYVSTANITNDPELVNLTSRLKGLLGVGRTSLKTGLTDIGKTAEDCKTAILGATLHVEESKPATVFVRDFGT